MAQGTLYKRILLPTDFSGASDSAALHALSLARQNKARLYLLHVVDTSREAAGFYLPHLSYEKLDREMKDSAREMLKSFAVKFFKGYKPLETLVLTGEPAKEILKTVRGNRIDLVVMGTFGHARIDRFFFGSTTERVVRKAGCPVLVIPPQKG